MNHAIRLNVSYLVPPKRFAATITSLMAWSPLDAVQVRIFITCFLILCSST